MEPGGEQRSFPAGLARAAIWALPPPALQAGASALLRGIGRRHPRLFRDLASLPPARILIAPTDLPHRFLLTLGGGPPRLSLAAATESFTASLKGRFAALIDLLEGRLDGDTLFFSRALTLTGDTAAVVGLRNTLDRETIDLLSEAAALFGPFAAPARAAARRLERLVDLAHRRIVLLHAALHAADPQGRSAPHPTPHPATAPDLSRLRTDLDRLAGRLAALEGKERRRPHGKAA
ncbi:MAG: SCP2 sterol-binding domain-containing protein [Rhodospirillales bacterium]|nr:SCP2 sterol-binding domain-containing protein [Rhodospirillales bacterium]